MSTLIISPGPITTVTLNRPDVRNAFDEALIDELTAFASSITADGSVRAVVLQGAGAVFSAGADVAWMAKMLDYSRDENLQDARRAASMFYAIDAIPVPVIARIQGAALGGGAGLAAVADVVVAASDAVFGFTEVTLGILPAMISPYVVRKIGLSAARELCLSGARFSAARAREIGLVHEVVSAERLDLAVDKYVQQFRKTAPSAVAATKALLASVYGRSPGRQPADDGRGDRESARLGGRPGGHARVPREAGGRLGRHGPPEGSSRFMIRRVLVANRGEIACRVIRGCRAMGLETVAVYSDADVEAPHVGLADAAVALGPAPALESYLSIPRLIDAVRQSGADAVHPGYGFLSENPDFAEACATARVTFVGPPAGVMRRMGSKSGAREAVAKAGVPVVPGAIPRAQTSEAIAAAVRDVGFPALIKAAAGGGGKGMRVVRTQAEVADAVNSRAARGRARVRQRRAVRRAAHRTAPAHRSPDPRRHARQRRALLRARVLAAAAASEGHRGVAGAPARGAGARAAAGARRSPPRARCAT